MTVPLLCAVILFFLGWVMVLKTEMSDLRKEIERLKSLLKNKLGHLEKEVSVSGSLRIKSDGK